LSSTPHTGAYSLVHATGAGSLLGESKSVAASPVSSDPHEHGSPSTMSLGAVSRSILHCTATPAAFSARHVLP